MNEEEININRLNNSFENLLQSGGGDDMWKIASKYAKQFNKGQIYALTRIKFYARKASPETKNILMGFYDDYVEMHTHYNTARFIALLARSKSLEDFMGQGIQGQVKIDK